MEWIDPCARDEVTTTSSINDKIYNIGLTEAVVEFTTWTQTEANCPISHELFIVENGSQRPLSSFEAGLVIFDEESAHITIENMDQYAVEGQTWEIVAVTKSTNSKSVKQSASITFKIEWVDLCKTSNLQAP